MLKKPHKTFLLLALLYNSHLPLLVSCHVNQMLLIHLFYLVSTFPLHIFTDLAQKVKFKCSLLP